MACLKLYVWTFHYRDTVINFLKTALFYKMRLFESYIHSCISRDDLMTFRVGISYHLYILKLFLNTILYLKRVNWIHVLKDWISIIIVALRRVSDILKTLSTQYFPSPRLSLELSTFNKILFDNCCSIKEKLHPTNYSDWFRKEENFNKNVNFLNVSQGSSQSHFLIKQSNPRYRLGISRDAAAASSRALYRRRKTSNWKFN